MTLTDPWAIPGTEQPDRGRRHWPDLAVAWVVSTAPAAIVVWDNGAAAQRSALLMLGAGAVWFSAVGRRRRSALVVAAAAVGMAVAIGVAVTRIGRAPGVLVAVSIVIATVAVSELRPPGRHVAHLPLAAIAATGVAWIATPSLRSAAVGLTAASLLVLWSWFHSASFIAVQRAVARAATASGRVARTLGLLLVLTPTLYLATCCAVPLRRARARAAVRRGSNWSDRHVERDDERREAHRPFAAVDRRRRIGLNLTGLVVIAAILVVILDLDERPTTPPSTTATGPGPTGETPTTISPRDQLHLGELPAFEGADWADALGAEQDEFSPNYAAVSNGDNRGVNFSGRFITVVNGERQGAKASCACRRVDVWWFGGSAAFGWDQRDAGTIPSSLTRLGEADGLDLRIRNMAAPGVTSFQQYQTLLTELAATADADLPDLIVFYDGFNDLTASIVQAANDGKLDTTQPALLDQQRFLDYQHRPTSLAPAGGPGVVGRAAARRYLRTFGIIEDLASTRGVPVLSVLQADAFPSIPQLEFVRRSTLAVPEVVQRSEFAKALNSAEQEMSPSVLDLRRSLSDVEEPVFADPVHTNERGAELVAAALYPQLRDRLAPAAG